MNRIPLILIGFIILFSTVSAPAQTKTESTPSITPTQSQTTSKKEDLIQQFYGRTTIPDCNAQNSTGCLKNLQEKKSCEQC
ncbi:MAG: hypothetical protein HN580_19575, partial [Deltaproteobacteria bacterium]|nr:hypothetical protein [Deltaproteobacteria bacterium]